MTLGWIVHTGDWSAAVSAPARGKARFVADSHYGEHQTWLEDVLRWRVLRCPTLDGKPVGVLEDLHSMRLAGIYSDEREADNWGCDSFNPGFDELGRYCGMHPVCWGCGSCAACGCICETP